MEVEWLVTSKKIFTIFFPKASEAAVFVNLLKVPIKYTDTSIQKISARVAIKRRFQPTISHILSVICKENRSGQETVKIKSEIVFA